MNLLEIEELVLRYGDGRAALERVSLTVAAGEMVALIGRSGSGKSSVALAAIGLLPPDARMEGAVRLEGVDLTRLPEPAMERVRGGRIGMIFQEPASALNPALTIGRQIGETVARHRRVGRAALRAEVAALLARVGLTVAPDRYPHELSGGQRQRVAIAIAIASDPVLLIADEPTAALDPIARAEIMALLAGLTRERRMGLLLISHDLALVSGMADRLVVIEEGHVVEAGLAAGLLDAPTSGALRAMLAAGAPLPPREARAAGEALLAARLIGRRYRTGPRFLARKVTALDRVSFDLYAGETLAVVGGSGSGKSTLARLVLGLEPADTGLVTLGGRRWLGARGAALRAMRRMVQAVFQDPVTSLDPRQRVEQIVAEPLHLLVPALSAEEKTQRVEEALAQVGLSPGAARRYPGQFSGGQRQRIALARALILQPKIVVLDEALSALDPAVSVDMLRLLRRLQDQLGLAYLFISHDLGLVSRFADRVIVLHEGRVVEQGAVAEVLGAPRAGYTAALIAAAGIG